MKCKAILIADDNLGDVLAIKLVLTEAKITNPLHSVEGGDEAIAYLAGEGQYADRSAYPYPVVLLLDLRMPEKSGLEVLEWIRIHAEHQRPRVIAVTGVSNLQEVRQAYQLGAHSFLVKPLSAVDFMSLANGLTGLRVESTSEGCRLDFDGGAFGFR